MSDYNLEEAVNYFEGPRLFTTDFGFYDTEDLEIRKILERKNLKWWTIKRKYYWLPGSDVRLTFIRTRKKDRDKMVEVFGELDRTLTLLYGERYLKGMEMMNRVLHRCCGEQQYHNNYSGEKDMNQEPDASEPLSY